MYYKQCAGECSGECAMVSKVALVVASELFLANKLTTVERNSRSCIPASELRLWRDDDCGGE